MMERSYNKNITTSKISANAWFSTETYPGLCLSIPCLQNNISAIFQKIKGMWDTKRYIKDIVLGWFQFTGH